MKDTPDELDELYRAMLLSRRGEERLRMACSMFDTAVSIAASSIRDCHPGVDQRELRRRLFLRLYGRDFSPDELERMLEAF